MPVKPIDVVMNEAPANALYTGDLSTSGAKASGRKDMALVHAPTPRGIDAQRGGFGTAEPTATVRPPRIARSRCHCLMRAPDLIPILRAASGFWRTSV